MFACGWLKVLVLASSVAYTKSRQEVLVAQHLSQAEAEAILSSQTCLRRFLISSLSDVRETTVRTHPFAPVLDGIIQDLQTRDLDPLKSLGKDNDIHKQHSLAEIIYNLQGGRNGPTLLDWNSLLQTISPLPQPPNLPLTVEQMQRTQMGGEDLVGCVLKGIYNNNIRLERRLLGDVLYNFPFRDYSPELVMILDNINQTLDGEVNGLHFPTYATSIKQPEDILADILKFLSRDKQSDEGFVYQIGRLLSALSDEGSVADVKAAPETGGLLDLMLRGDYPSDVIAAKDALSSAIKSNRIGVDLSGVSEAMKGHPPVEKLLVLMGKLTSLPRGSPFFREVHAVYPHVKLRYLSGKGKYFRPRTANDLRFLLGSFFTVPHQMETVILEVQKVLILSDWERVLENFDYSRYSKPRPLVVDMVAGLLDNPSGLPVCSIIILKYFLSKNRGTCTENEEYLSVAPMIGATPASSLHLKRPFASESGRHAVDFPVAPLVSPSHQPFASPLGHFGGVPSTASMIPTQTPFRSAATNPSFPHADHTSRVTSNDFSLDPSLLEGTSFQVSTTPETHQSSPATTTVTDEFQVSSDLLTALPNAFNVRPSAENNSTSPPAACLSPEPEGDIVPVGSFRCGSPTTGNATDPSLTSFETQTVSSHEEPPFVTESLSTISFEELTVANVTQRNKNAEVLSSGREYTNSEYKSMTGDEDTSETPEQEEDLGTTLQ